MSVGLLSFAGRDSDQDSIVVVSGPWLWRMLGFSLGLWFDLDPSGSPLLLPAPGVIVGGRVLVLPGAAGRVVVSRARRWCPSLKLGFVWEVVGPLRLSCLFPAPGLPYVWGPPGWLYFVAGSCVVPGEVYPICVGFPGDLVFSRLLCCALCSFPVPDEPYWSGVFWLGRVTLVGPFLMYPVSLGFLLWVAVFGVGLFASRCPGIVLGCPPLLLGI